MIGQDNSEALVPLQVLKGNPGDPFAVFTKFGWTLNSIVPGSSPDCVSFAVVSNFVHTSINAKVEVLGDTADDHVDPTLNSLSVSTDCKVLDICYGESDLVDGHVDLPIPQEVSHLDNNFPVVLSSCYKPLLTSVDKISVMSDCDEAVKTIICKGLAEDIPVDVVQNHDPMTCYIPYHPVFKRSGDIYFVSNCSCSSQEYSFDDCVSHTLDSNLNNLSNFFLYRRQHEDAMSTDVLSMYNQVSLFHHDRNTLRFLWNVNDSVVHYGKLVHPFGGVCNCTCPAISLLHECTHSAMDVGLNLSYIYDGLLSMISTDKTSNLDIKSESVLSFYGFDPTKCFVYDPPMARLIPDFNMSLDVDTIFAAHASQPESMLSNSCDFDPRKCLVYDPSMFRLISDCNMSLDTDAILTAHSQLVSKILGVSWVMPLKQWLSWVKSLDSWINNTCLVLCCQFVFDNG